MGKQKKRKTEYVSDAEIWDDSALIQSWDAAVAEYEVSYTSIQGQHSLIGESTTTAFMREVKMWRKY